MYLPCQIQHTIDLTTWFYSVAPSLGKTSNICNLMSNLLAACYKHIANAFDCSLAHGYQKINNTTDVRGYGTKTYRRKATTGKDSLLTTQRQTVMDLMRKLLAVDVGEDPMALENSGPSARSGYTADQRRSRCLVVVVNR